MNKCVLITGGAGFLGTNLINKFVIENYVKKIIIVDNFITGQKNNIIKLNQDEIFQKLKKAFSINIELIECDICDFEKLNNLILQKHEFIDEIYHMASLASPPFYRKYPLETLDVGYIGTKNILELCKIYNNRRKCKLMYTSTSEVYGDAKEHPQNENYYGNVNCYGSRSCYDCSKRIGETLIYTYRELYNLDTRIVRIFNTYGPYMNLNDGRIVTEIIKAKLLDTELNIFGNGKQTRSLSYVDNTLNLMMFVMNSEYTSPVNIGDDEELNINDLVQVIKNLNTKNSYLTNEIKVRYTEIDKDDPKVRKPDLSLISNIIKLNGLKYNKINLDSRLLKTIEFFEKELTMTQ